MRKLRAASTTAWTRAIAPNLKSLSFSIAQQVVARPYRLWRPAAQVSRTVNYRRLVEVREALTPEAANSLLADAFSSQRDSPFFAGRLGSTELKAMSRMVLLESRSLSEKLFAFIARLEPGFWTRVRFRELLTQSGFFPVQRETVNQFVEIMRDSLHDIDLFGSWVPGESLFADDLRRAKICPAPMDPFSNPRNPWTASLEGQRVLVVHPFSETIETQYERSRDKLFPGSNLLPEFTLDVVRAPLTLNGPTAEVQDWFEALDNLSAEVEGKKFDVAILGCGAYGFPLASRIKRNGGKVINLGGTTQLLFGIKGWRWDHNGFGDRWYNDLWIRPLPADTPSLKRGRTREYW